MSVCLQVCLFTSKLLLVYSVFQAMKEAIFSSSSGTLSTVVRWYWTAGTLTFRLMTRKKRETLCHTA